MKPACLELRDLRRDFATPEGPREILRGLRLDIRAGERIVLFGPSGCGKTTLLHLMAFLDLPSGGEIRFRGASTADWSEARRCEVRAREIGMVFQQFHLLPRHSVMDNLLLRQRYLKQPPTPPVPPEDLLSLVGLADRAEQAARLLSGGEKQRLCIARAMLLQPALFLADEPTGNLDGENAERVRGLFAEVSGRGAAMVIATHDPAWFGFATRILRFDGGLLVEDRP